MRYVASHDVAKAFGRYQDEALSEQPIAVTRYGRPSVVILSFAEYERLRSGGSSKARREVMRASEIPDDLLQAIGTAEASEEARAFDHEVMADEPA
jgi:prevent-host-death family protein